uniref:CCHC-type domain-containing protein n=1 Tax=Cannabis sativa TaxID=3483 RepID=A0A803QEM7_CANSA
MFVLIENCPEKPLVNDSDNAKKKYDHWIRSNELARSYLLNNMSDVFKTMYQHMETAHEIMKSLENMFAHPEIAIHETMDDLINNRMKPGQYVHEYVFSMIQNFHEVLSNGAKIDQATQVAIILHALPSTFDEFRTIYVINKCKFSVYELLNALLDYETKQKDDEEANVVSKTKQKSNEEANVVHETKQNGVETIAVYETKQKNDEANVVSETKKKGDEANVDFETKQKADEVNVIFETKQKSDEANVVHETKQKDDKAIVVYETTQKGDQAIVVFETKQKSDEANVVYETKQNGGEANIDIQLPSCTIKQKGNEANVVHNEFPSCTINKRKQFEGNNQPNKNILVEKSNKKAKSTPKGKCFYCKVKGHRKMNCPKYLEGLKNLKEKFSS